MNLVNVWSRSKRPILLSPNRKESDANVDLERRGSEADQGRDGAFPTQEYEDEHIEGAINIPLKGLNRDTTSHLDRARPLIVY